MEEAIITLDDFIPGQSGYQAEAIQKDIRASVQFYRVSANASWYGLRTSYEKVAEFGRLGRHQEQRAKVLEADLLARVKNELLGRGWHLIETTHGGEYWEHRGLLTDALQAQLEKAALKIWRGSYDRVERDKVAPVDVAEWLYQIPTSYWIELSNGLSISLNPYTRLLHVHRKSQAPPDQIEQVHQEVRSRIVSVVGNENAKMREDQGPAYQREIETRLVTFKCIWCEKRVTQQRFPGRKPSYCSPLCEVEGKREKTRARVQKYREKRHQ